MSTGSGESGGSMGLPGEFAPAAVQAAPTAAPDRSFSMDPLHGTTDRYRFAVPLLRPEELE